MRPEKHTLEEWLALTFSQSNRGEKPNARAPETPEEYILQRGDGLAISAMKVGTVQGLGLPPEQFMRDQPAWLGAAPEITDIAYEENCQVLVIGAGQSGTAATLRCAELGLDVLCLETQTWEEYDNYACDMATYNSEFARRQGVPDYDPAEIFNEYMRKALGHAHPQLVKDYAFRSGEMLDWLLTFIPADYVKRFSSIHNKNGNRNYKGNCCHQLSFIGMLQWRDQATNMNMWPFVVRTLHVAAEAKGARHIYGAQAVCLMQDKDGTVSGCIARDINGHFFRVRSQRTLLATGDFGGNPDMLLDLNDQMRNLAWSFGKDRCSAEQLMLGGRDGSGIRMALWAGATMESGPRAAQGGYINRKPIFPFGGAWPCFGPDGKRFENETLVKHGIDGIMDMMTPGGIVAIVTDSNWDSYCEAQGYGHEVMDRSNAFMMETVRREMAQYVTGPTGFPVQYFARYGREYVTVYAAETVEELGRILGYEGENLASFLTEVQHWNELCRAGCDTDWGCDTNHLFPIVDPPFFGMATVLGAGKISGGLCQHGGVCTDGMYRVLNKEKLPIEGLYAVGNTCGQRYGVQYHTPTAGNCCGSALTNGYVVAEYITNSLK